MKISNYKKKPVIIQAVEWTGGEESAAEIIQWMEDNGRDAAYFPWGSTDYDLDNEYLGIFTLEGMMYASVGDYIIRGIEGEFYPCKPGIFHDSYEQV